MGERVDKKKPNLYEALEWAESVGADGFNFTEFKYWAKSALTFSDWEGKEETEANHVERSISRVWKSLHECSVRCAATGDSREERFVLKVDASFLLLEYQELQEARENARSAHKTALVAIGLSILTLIASICFSYAQLESPVRIAGDQFEMLEDKISFLGGSIRQFGGDLTESDKSNRDLLFAELSAIEGVLRELRDRPVEVEVSVSRE